MIDEIKTGGPAFPAPDDWKRDSGMTLRDYFAAKALQAIVSTVPHLSAIDPKDAAEESYDYADAMLKARAA